MGKNLPSLLVSFVLLKKEHMPFKYGGFDEWVMDSGAYSAHNSGVKIKNEEFVQYALNAQKKDKRLKHIFALDVIGDHSASLENALEAKKLGLEVIPTWHAGEPLEFAQEMAKQFPKVALGGLVGKTETKGQSLSPVKKMHYAMKFFQAVWPKWIHGLGCLSEAMLNELPFSSADSSSWQMQPKCYGRWRCFGQSKIPLRYTKETASALRAEVDWFLDREAFHDATWRRELVKVDCERFRIRLACVKEDIKNMESLMEN